MRFITYRDILTRKNSLNKLDLVAEQNAIIYEKRYKLNGYGKLNFLRECKMSTLTANRYIQEIMDLYESEDISTKYMIANEIIPCIYPENLNECNTDDEAIKIAVEKDRIADRILDNHEKICTKTDIESFFNTKSWSSDELVDLSLFKIAEAVDQFNVVDRGKVIITLEEFFYIANKYNIVYEDADIIDKTVKCFMVKDELKDLSKLDAALKKNKIMDYDIGDNEIDPIDTYLLSPVKNIDLLEKVLDDILVLKDPTGIKCYFELLRLILANGTNEEIASGIYNVIIPKLYDKLISGEFIPDDYLKSRAEYTMNILQKEYNIGMIYVKRFSDENIASRFTHYCTAISDAMNNISSILEFVYSYDNIKNKNICLFSVLNENNSDLTLNEFKLFKHQNLITLVGKIDHLITAKYNSAATIVKKEVRKIKDKLFKEDTMESLFDAYGNINTSVSLLEGNITHDIINFAESVCNDINQSSLRGTNYILYYTATESTIEFNLREYRNINNYSDLDMDHYISESDINNLYEVCGYIDIDRIPQKEDIQDYIESCTDSEFETFLELASYAGIDKDTVEEISLYNDYKPNGYESKFVSNDIQLEAVELLSYMIYEDAKKPDPNNKKKLFDKDKAKENQQMIKDKTKETVDKVKADPDKSLKLNDIKLALEGLKKKVKDADAKVQNMSRQADAQFAIFSKNLKNAFVSDRREAIIKGSVIPSFSRCVKIGIGLIGLGIIGQGPLLPAIAAIGSFAVSKNLTRKERVLLLDEIETELEVIDREIQIADSKNQMKKLRALLNTKKNLQRQYQRIKYNTRIGKDLLPSSMGVERK